MMPRSAPSVRELHAVGQVGGVTSASPAPEPRDISTTIDSALQQRGHEPSLGSSSSQGVYADSVYGLCLEGIPFLRFAKDTARMYYFRIDHT